MIGLICKKIYKNTKEKVKMKKLKLVVLALVLTVIVNMIIPLVKVMGLSGIAIYRFKYSK